MKNHLPTLAHLLLLALLLTPGRLQANLTGPYTPDANTLVLLHLDQPTGSSSTPNAGTLGGNFYSVNYSADTLPLPVVTSMLGATGYSTNSPTAITFNKCEYNTTAGLEMGYDYNGDGAFQGDNGSGTSVDFFPMSKLNIGNGGQTPFTLEALIQPTSTNAAAQEIICADSQAGSRAFQFKLSGSVLLFQFITGSQALSGNIPSSGGDAFIPGTWYHVAFTYDGAKGTLYWTRLDPSIGAAHVLTTGTLAIGASDGTVNGPLVIANRSRPTGTETFLGGIDEVRISNVARAANQMAFFSPLVTITQNPVSQNVDYNQPVTFSVGASSLTTLGYQWLVNSNAIAGATNSSYTITNVAAGNAGYYTAVVTNTSGNSATSAPALLVVGAANFLNHRYSFATNFNSSITNITTTTNNTVITYATNITTDVLTPDSIAGANGTLFGDAVVTNGSLVLDGTTGTYLQLPANLVNGANATALTVEFWATFGVNANNAYVFSFGTTNYLLGSGLVGFNYLCYSPHNASGQGLIISPSQVQFQQQTTASGTLDGLTLHVACVVDPPNQTMAIYTNGVLEAVNTNMTVGLANISDVFSYIGASLFTGDPYLNANIDELRVYNGALSGLSTAQSDLLGPNKVLSDGPATFVTQPASPSVPLGQTATLAAAATGYLPITYQWVKNGSLIPGATNASYAYVPALADNGATFFCRATNTIGVTTYVTNSMSATLHVFIPPTLSWLGTADGGADGTWNTTSLDWTNDLTGGGIVAYAQTNGALFDDRSGGGSVDLEQPIVPYNITVNAASSYSFNSYGGLGLLTGQASLVKKGAGTLDIDLTNTLSGPVTIAAGELQVGYFDALGSLGSGPVTNNATLSFNRGDTALVAGNAIHGTGTVSFDGGGTVTINGTSDYTGSTLINQGILNLQSAAGLGAASSATLAGSDGELYITANVNVPQALTINGSGPDGNGALHKGGAGVTLYTGPVFMASDSSIGVDGGATLVLSNTLSGAAALTALGSGTLTLAEPNSFQNGLTVNGPAINVNTNGAVGPGPVTVSGAGRLVLATGINLTNFVDASTVNPGVGNGVLMVADNTNGIVTTISGPVEFDTTASSGGNFVGPTTSGYLNVTGPVTNTATGLVTVRAGNVRFSGGGNYGTLNLTGTGSIGANNGVSTNAELAVGPSGGGTFDLNGFSQILTGLADGTVGATATELVTNSSAQPGVLTLNLINSGYTYGGVIGGSVALVVEGFANEYLSGINTYTGNTTVLGGSLELALPTLSPYSTVSVTNGAILQLDFPGTNVISGLVLNGVSQPLGVYNNTSSSAYLYGSGSLQVAVTIAANPTNITATVSGGNLSLSWPADHLGWILQSQTNSLSHGLATNWVDIAGSSSATQAVFHVVATNPAVFYRLRHP